jgi:hypothetical protein
MVDESIYNNPRDVMEEIFQGWKIKLLISDPKRIQRRLRITQNLQKQLRKLRMALVDKERENIQIHQNSVKLASSQRARRKISNDVNNSSNRVTDQKIFTVKGLVNLAQLAGMSQHPYC